jgi:hypothetical protein
MELAPVGGGLGGTAAQVQLRRRAKPSIVLLVGRNWASRLVRRRVRGQHQSPFAELKTPIENSCSSSRA